MKKINIYIIIFFSLFIISLFFFSKQINNNNFYGKLNSKSPVFSKNYVDSMKYIDEITIKSNDGKLYTLNKKNTFIVNNCNSLRSGHNRVVKQDGTCIQIKKDDLTDINEYYNSLKESGRLVGTQKIDKISFEDENFRDGYVTINGEKIFVFDFTDVSFFELEGGDIRSKLFQILELSGTYDKKQKIYLIHGKGDPFQDNVLMFVKDDYLKIVETLKQEKRKAAKEVLNQKLDKKFKSKKNEIIAKTYQYISKQYKYCDECITGERDIFEGMDGVQTLKRKNGVCDGFAKSMFYILDYFGIEAEKITGLGCSTEKCETHAWVKIEFNKKNKKTNKIRKVFRFYDPTYENGITMANNSFSIKRAHYFANKKKDFGISHIEGYFFDKDKQGKGKNLTENQVKKILSVIKGIQ